MRIAILATILALVVAPAAAQVNPQNLPTNTLYGRLGVGSGPGQAIPFSVLQPSMAQCPGSGGILTVINVTCPQFGAQGTLVDDTAAIQAAINYAETLQPGRISAPCVYLPRPPNAYLITSTLTWTSTPCMIGDGPHASTIYSTSNIPYVTLDTTSGSMFYAKISGLGFESGNVGTRTSEAGIKIIGANNVDYSDFDFNYFIGTYRGIWFANTGTANDWIKIIGNTCTNNGTNVPNDCFYLPGGNGTGLVISNNVIGATTNCILTVNYGDITITGNQTNTCVNGENITSNGAHIISMGNEFDAGVTNAYTLTSVRAFTADDLMPAFVGISVTTPTDWSIFIKRKVISAAALSASQNDWTFGSNLWNSLGINVTPSSTWNITGFAGTGDAQEFYVYNAGSSSITYVCNSSSSQAANRINCSSNYVQAAGTVVWFIYNMSTTQWNISAHS